VVSHNSILNQKRAKKGSDLHLFREKIGRLSSLIGNLPAFNG
jgi:hypothetical protein